MDWWSWESEEERQEKAHKFHLSSPKINALEWVESAITNVTSPHSTSEYEKVGPKYEKKTNTCVLTSTHQHCQSQTTRRQHRREDTSPMSLSMPPNELHGVRISQHSFCCLLPICAPCSYRLSSLERFARRSIQRCEQTTNNNWNQNQILFIYVGFDDDSSWLRTTHLKFASDFSGCQ